jgi:hypothetical protein
MTESGKGSYALKALHKHDGGEAATIPLGSDKSPRYEVDGITNAVYLVDGTAVTCYRP